MVEDARVEHGFDDNGQLCTGHFLIAGWGRGQRRRRELGGPRASLMAEMAGHGINGYSEEDDGFGQNPWLGTNLFFLHFFVLFLARASLLDLWL